LALADGSVPAAAHWAGVGVWVGAAVILASVANAEAVAEAAADAAVVAAAEPLAAPVGATLPVGDDPADGVAPPPVQAQASSAAARAKPVNLKELVMGVSPLPSSGAGPLPGAQQPTMTLRRHEA
jgi:hypothetical protein